MAKWFRKREMWVPAWRCWLVIIVCLCFALFLPLRFVYPFLALVEPAENADVLVLEGWLPDYAVKEAAELFRSGEYRWICTTGVEVEVGMHFTEAKTYAGLGAATLLDNGIGEESLIIAHGPRVYRDRTYHSAAALRSELEERELLADVRGIDLVSFGTHARRSRNTFRTVLGRDVSVGVISIQTRGYNPKRWYRYSAGVKAVLMELISLTYEQFQGYRPTEDLLTSS